GQILENESLIYWAVRLKDTNVPIGVITFIQRDYLANPDLGFAFLPEYNKKGYAQEAATVVIQDILTEYTELYAFTLPENESSIRLLERLGFLFQKEFELNDEILSLYSVYN